MDRKYTPTRISSKYTFLLATLLFWGCNKHLQYGLYSSSDVASYHIELNEDGAYDYRYVYHLCNDVSSGKWTQVHNSLILTSNVLNVQCFPVQIAPLEIKKSDSIVVVFKNFNLTYYDWFCDIHGDTLRIVNDTLVIVPLVDSTSCMRIRASRLNNRRLSLLPGGDNASYYAAPRHLSVQSQPINLSETMGIMIIVDSVFGENPFNYLPMHGAEFKITKNGIQDKWKGFSLDHAGK